LLQPEKAGRMTHLGRSALVAGFVLALTGSAGSAELREDFSGSEPLGGLAQTGTDGAWTASLDNGAYTFTNDTEAQAIRYVHLGALPGGAGNLANATVEVDVTVDGRSNPSGAGIMYRFDPASRTYLLFALLSSGDYAIYIRNQKGAQQVARGSVTGVKPAGNRLSLTPEGELVRFSINDQAGPTVKVGEAGGTSIGIAALGKGTFTFDNLLIRDAG
jgi:hypothetical protein